MLLHLQISFYRKERIYKEVLTSWIHLLDGHWNLVQKMGQ